MDTAECQVEGFNVDLCRSQVIVNVFAERNGILDGGQVKVFLCEGG